MKKINLQLIVVVFAIALIGGSSLLQGGVSQGNERNTKTGNMALHSNTSGSDNTADGDHALYSNTTGNQNTVSGSGALFSNTTGGGYTAVGYQALFSINDGGLLGIGVSMTAIGYQALYSTIETHGLTAVGYQALFSNTTGAGNTAVGWESLSSNTTGAQNTANGVAALQSNTTGGGNTATGNNNLGLNTTGSSNTADGQGALDSNTTGSGNTATGRFALFNNTTGSNNIALGFHAGNFLTTGDNNIEIGNLGAGGESNTIRIGDQSIQTSTFVAGIFGAATAGGIPVYVDANGQLGTIPSSQRFKDDIKPMDKASNAIFSLRPVAFRYKKEIDPKKTAQFGLVAEEVAKVDPDLVARDGKGKIYSVRYEAVNAMLLNEFLKEHKKVEELQVSRNTEQKEIAELKRQLQAQAAVLQEVSDRLEIDIAATRTIASDE